MFTLTGRAVDFAEDFAERDEEWKKIHGKNVIIELSEDAQIDLFQIMSMYERDKGFQHFMRGCNALYSLAMMTMESGYYYKMMNKFEEMLKEAIDVRSELKSKEGD